MAAGAVFSTPFRRPHNFARGTDGGGVHDDATAQKLGMRGGTVAGQIHMNQFVPLLHRAFGERAWFEHGCLSCYFLSPTVHLEPVRAFARLPPGGGPAAVWMETEAGVRVLDGTASVGSGAPPSALEARLARARAPSAPLRILAGVSVGDVSPRLPARYTWGEALKGLGNLEWGPAQAALLQEPHAWFTDAGASPWGQRVLPPQHCFNIFNQRKYQGQGRRIFPKQRGAAAVGLIGGIEFRTLGRGPILCDHDYTVEWEVAGLEDSPKTEIMWTRGTLRELDGTAVAASLVMLRSMKASSPLYTAAAAKAAARGAKM